MNPRDCFIHVTSSISRLAGGLFESVRHLSRGVQRASRADVSVLGLQDERAGLDQYCWAPLRVRTQAVFGPSNFGFAPSLAAEVPARLVGALGTYLFGVALAVAAALSLL